MIFERNGPIVCSTFFALVRIEVECGSFQKEVWQCICGNTWVKMRYVAAFRKQVWQECLNRKECMAVICLYALSFRMAYQAPSCICILWVFGGLIIEATYLTPDKKRVQHVLEGSMTVEYDNDSRDFGPFVPRIALLLFKPLLSLNFIWGASYFWLWITWTSFGIWLLR